MKVAILLFGQPRFFNITKSFIRDEFDLPGHEVDFFAHFWDRIGYLPKGEEELYNVEELYSNVRNSLPNVRDLNIQSYDTAERCSNLNEVCNFIGYFAEKLHTRPLPIHNNLETLRYKFGQHWSMKRCFDRICNYEERHKFKYDLVIKVRTDIVYKPQKCYSSQEEYLKAKEDYYFNNIEWDKPMIKAVALRLLDLTAKMNKQSDRGYTQTVNRFYNNKFKLLKDPLAGWLDYVENYTIRLALNDWSLISNRSAAEIIFGNWFENYFITLSKDIKNNKKSNSFISMSDHSLQGQFLLNYPILAERLYDRRDVRLLHPTFIKEETIPTGKLLARTEKNLKIDLEKYWSEK